MDIIYTYKARPNSVLWRRLIDYICALLANYHYFELDMHYKQNNMKVKSYFKLSCIPLLLLLFGQSLAVYGQSSPVIHAHRGGAALYPENTIEAMLYSISIGVRVIELDLHITSDSMVVVSHDPYMNHKKALTPEGKKIGFATQLRHKIFSMPYGTLKQYDVGSLPQANYPDRVNIRASVPLLSDLIDQVEAYTKKYGIAPVTYNIEIKSHTLKDGRLTPHFDTFIQLVMRVLQPRKLAGRFIIQSFDVRTLNYIHIAYPEVQLAYLVKKRGGGLNRQLAKLKFTPTIYSPHYKLVDKRLVTEVQRRGMQIIPWTVDNRPEALRLRDLGVDGIITNYPNRLQDWLTEGLYERQ